MASEEELVQCHNCLEFVSASLTNCRFCGAVITAENVRVEETLQAKLAQANREGNLLKLLSRALTVCFLALTFSIFSKLALAGFLLLLVVVPILLVRWWVKYGRLPSEEQAYLTAKRDAIFSAVIWGGIVFVWLAASAIQSFLFAQR
mgnify:CR=1 FL=1